MVKKRSNLARSNATRKYFKCGDLERKPKIIECQKKYDGKSAG
jgi:hypothetical protein